MSHLTAGLQAPNLTRHRCGTMGRVTSSDGTIRPVLSLLGQCAVDTEQHVARAGWDQPARLFAIARNSELLEREPALAGQLVGTDPEGYSTIEQEGLLEGSSIEETLGRVAWPEEVVGAALSIERIVVPPSAEQELPAERDAAVDALAQHPDRQDVRLLVAVLRDGEGICLLRQRAHDEDDKVAIGNDIAPGLLEALRSTFA